MAAEMVYARIRWYANQIENLSLQAFWRNPEFPHFMDEHFGPFLDWLEGAGKGSLAECPPGTRDCGDGTCRPKCPRPSPLSEAFGVDTDKAALQKLIELLQGKVRGGPAKGA